MAASINLISATNEFPSGIRTKHLFIGWRATYRWTLFNVFMQIICTVRKSKKPVNMT